MSMDLTPGAAAQLVDDSTESSTFQPIVQVLSVKKIPATAQGNSVDRYRLILSDGEHFIQSMLATQLNHYVDDRSLDRHTVIQLNGYALNNVQGRRLVIALDINPLQQLPEKIGAPVNLESATGNNQSAQQPAPVRQPAAAAPVTRPAAAAPAARGGFQSARGGASAAAPAARGRGAPTAGRGGRGGAAGGGAAGSHGPLYPIEGLSPYQNKWTIKARVVQKSDIKTWSNARGEGKLFSVTFMDETGEIKATGFNEECDRFHNLLEENKVYFVTKARINIAKKQFSTVNNDYEITFGRDTEIDVSEDEGAVPQVQYNFVDLAKLGDMEKDNICDVLAVVKECAEVTSITGKATNKPIPKRDLTIVDRSGFSCRMTLWGKTAENFNNYDQPIIAFKGVKVGDFGGRTLSMYSSSTMTLSPDIPEAHSLRGWYDSNPDYAYKSHSSSGGGLSSGPMRADDFKTIADVHDQQIGMNDKVDFFNTKATVLYIKTENYSYPACSTEGCNKKVNEEANGWRCEKCDRSWPKPNHRYILSFSVVDHTGQMWLTGFNDIGEALLGMTANELKEREGDQDGPGVNPVIKQAIGATLNFNVSGKMDSFNDQARARFSIKRAAQLDYKSETRSLLEKIKAFGI